MSTRVPAIRDRLWVIVGVTPGASGVGYTLTLDHQVLEAESVPTQGHGPTAVAESALQAVASARRMLADWLPYIQHACRELGLAVPRPLWCVEGPVISVARSQQARAIAARANVATAQVERSVSLGAVLSALMAEQVVLVGAVTKTDLNAYEAPAVLRGRIPDGWRGTPGSDRSLQRVAYAAACVGYQQWRAKGHVSPAPARFQDYRTPGVAGLPVSPPVRVSLQSPQVAADGATLPAPPASLASTPASRTQARSAVGIPVAPPSPLPTPASSDPTAAALVPETASCPCITFRFKKTCEHIRFA